MKFLVLDFEKRPLHEKKFRPLQNYLEASTTTTTFNLPNHPEMRPLTETETQTLFTKLANYTGNSLKNLIAPLGNTPNADRYVFRLHQSRCYYVRLSLANMAVSVSRDKLLSLGTCLGMSAIPVLVKANSLQANSPRLENSASTSPLFQSSRNTQDTRSGSRRMERCLSCMVATLSRHMLADGRRTARSIRV